MSVVTISYFRFGPLGARLWAFAQMGLARAALARTPGIGFHKMFGTGVGEGFTPLPNTSLYALLAVWEDIETARLSVNAAPVFKRYGERAREAYTVFLKPFSSRGAWDGAERFQPEDGEGQTVPEPIGFLTRATVRPRGARGFWGQSPGVSKSIGENPDVLFKAGMGEVPGLQQVTFSIWPNLKSMSRFAYRSAEHAGAIRAVREGDWFREELYARFEVLGTDGQWMGGDPVAAHLVKAAEARAVARAEEVQGA